MTVTHEVFLNRLSAINPNIEPLEQYKGSRVNILCRCKMCNHEWMVRPGNLLCGKGCPVCAIQRNAKLQTKKQDVFLTELSENNSNVLPLEPYIGANRKIRFRCKKCDNVWTAKPSHVLEGHACPVCGGSMRKDNSTFLSQLSKINPLITPLEPYVNAHKKILCICSICNNKWSAAPDKLLQGNGCPSCEKRNKTSFPEQALFFYLRAIFPDTVNRYLIPNSKKELDIFIPSLKTGIEYDGEYWHKSRVDQEVKKYQMCKEQGITLYRVREAETSVGDIADGIFVRSKPFTFCTLNAVLDELFSKMDVQVYVDTLKDAAAIREQFFSELSSCSLAEMFPKVAQEWHPQKNGEITPRMFSYGSNEKCWWQCSSCLHEWSATIVSRTKRGRGCPACFRARRFQHKAKTTCCNPQKALYEDALSSHNVKA